MDDLVPSSQFPPPSPSSTFKPLPSDPHSLVGSNSRTFPLAVQHFRSLLLRAATQHEERRQMGANAHFVASKRSWFGAMEMLVDGYREVVDKAQRTTVDSTFSRTSTIDVDIPSAAATRDVIAVPSKRRRLARIRQMRQSSQHLLTFSSDKSTQAICSTSNSCPHLTCMRSWLINWLNHSSSPRDFGPPPFRLPFAQVDINLGSAHSPASSSWVCSEHLRPSLSTLRLSCPKLFRLSHFCL